MNMFRCIALYLAFLIGCAPIGCAVRADQPGTVANHAFAIGKGSGVSGYTSLLCASGQLAVGTAANPACVTVSGDCTFTSAGVITCKPVRTILSAGRTFFVSTAGADVNGCGLASGASACATRNFLWAQLQTKYDLGCQAITISVAAGTYTETFPGNGDIPGDCYFGQITFTGDTTTPANVLIKPAVGANYPFEAQNGAKYFIQGFKLDGSNVGASIAGLVTPTWGSQIGIIGNMTFGCSPNSIDIQAGHGTYTFIASSYTIDKTGCSANSLNHIQEDPTALVQYTGGTTINLSGSPVYSQCWIANNHADANISGINFAANFGGCPFFIQGNGQIETNVGTGTAIQNPNYIPTAGSPVGSVTFSGTATNGSSAITGVAAGSITALQTLIGSHQGLLVVCTSCVAGTWPASDVVAQASNISGTTVTATYNYTGTTGAQTFIAGGFVVEGSHYYGSAGYSSIPPVP